MNCKKPINNKTDSEYFTIYQQLVYNEENDIIGEIDTSYYDCVFKHKNGKLYYLAKDYTGKYIIVGEIN